MYKRSISTGIHALYGAVAITGVFLVLAGVYSLAARIYYVGKVLPGVSSAGVNLAGLTEAEIRDSLQEVFVYPSNGLIVLQDQDRLWAIHPQELGVGLNFKAIAERALLVGREGGLIERLGGQWSAWLRGHSIAPVIFFDQEFGAKFLDKIADQINRPQIEAVIGVDGVSVAMNPGQIGRQLDIDTTLGDLIEPFSKLYDAQIKLTIEETPPLVLDVSEQSVIAEMILAEALVLTVETDAVSVIEPAELAQLLRFNLVDTEDGAQYEVGLDEDLISLTLEALAADLIIVPQNARFIFNEDSGELDLLESAVVGRALDIPATIAKLQSDLRNGIHEVEMVFQSDEPGVGDDATAEELGIREVVSVVSSYFSGSGSARVQNIKTSAAAFHGLLIAPGETLSMAQVLGDISLDTGYAEALIIFGDRTIKGVGGGVCQVSTTLYRAAFFGGYQLVERYPHAYRVRYYELGASSPGPGFDATVYVPLVDFKFTNDRDTWLLMETYVYDRQLVWKFYSTSDGREVEWSRQQFNAQDAPEALYKENEDLKKGEIKKVDWAADGLDVIVTRNVTLDGENLYEDRIETYYLPWRAIYEYGPGTKLPKGAKTEAE
ncbi:MAG: VanW family protein [Chloroflexi bacterium]|nr:VanW family protein [Chloroflexota bacterium]